MAPEIAVRVHPGQRRVSLRWEEWRSEWVVSCRAPANDGAANQELVQLIAGWLELPTPSVRIRVGGRSSSKRVEVDGLSDAEVAARLRTRAEPLRPKRRSGSGGASRKD